MRAGDHRRVGLGHAELLEQPVHLRVGLQIHPGEQHAVLGQEVADAEGVRGVARADHAQAGEIGRLAQQLPAGDERLEDDVAQAGHWFRTCRRPRPRSRTLRNRRGRSPLTTAGVPVRCEMSPVNSPCRWTGDRLRRVAGVVDDLDLARLDDEELEQTITDVDEGFTIAISFRGYRCAVRQVGNLVLIEDRKSDGMEGVRPWQVTTRP